MTILQKQCLLTYLGYYRGEMDGKWGSLSRAATESFQRDYGLQPDGIFGPATRECILWVIATGEAPAAGSPWGKFRHFSREDFRCKCGGEYCAGFPAEPDLTLVEIADRAVDHFGKSFDPARNLISGLRCPEHNKNQGGVANSRHISGKAMDLRIPGVTAAELLAFIQTQNIRYAYAINQTNVHFDVE